MHSAFISLINANEQKKIQKHIKMDWILYFFLHFFEENAMSMYHNQKACFFHHNLCTQYTFSLVICFVIVFLGIVFVFYFISYLSLINNFLFNNFCFFFFISFVKFLSFIVFVCHMVFLFFSNIIYFLDLDFNIIGMFFAYVNHTSNSKSFSALIGFSMYVVP